MILSGETVILSLRGLWPQILQRRMSRIHRNPKAANSPPDGSPSRPYDRSAIAQRLLSHRSAAPSPRCETMQILQRRMSRIPRSLEAANFSGKYVFLYDTTSGPLRPFQEELLLTLRPKLPALRPEPSLWFLLQE